MTKIWLRTCRVFISKLFFFRNFAWFLYSFVFVVGLRGSLSKLISLQWPAKSRHPDCSAHTQAHTLTGRKKKNKGRKASSLARYMLMLMYCLDKRRKKRIVNRFSFLCWAINGGLVNGDWLNLQRHSVSLGLDACRRLFRHDELLISLLPPSSFNVVVKKRKR